MSPSTVRVRVVLLAGPSGSGKSHLAGLAGRPELALDHFYLDGDHPGMPVRNGLVDWDDPASWDGAGALMAIRQLCATGRAEVPRYDIPTNRRTGAVTLDLGGTRTFVAEGVFAGELVAGCRTAGLTVDALYLARPRTLTLILRLVRDLREHRKPIGVLIRRGLLLWRTEPELRAQSVARGCRAVGLREAREVIAAGDRLRR